MEIKHYKETINHITYNVREQKNNFKYYFLNNQFHNESGPAKNFYYLNGNIKEETYYINNKIHNENGPAEIHYYPNGKIKIVYYWINHIYLNIKSDEELKQYLKYKDF